MELNEAEIKCKRGAETRKIKQNLEARFVKTPWNRMNQK